MRDMEDLDLPLNLSERTAAQSTFSAGISVDNMTWWFWIKAGMGLTIGMILMGLIMTIAWSLLFVGGLVTLGRAVAR